MAFRGNYDNNSKAYSPNVYSSYKMSNTEGIDPSAINFTFCLGMMKISISPMKKSDSGEVAFDHENAIEVFLTHTKAKTLHDEIFNMISNGIDSINNVSVNTGSDGLITFSNGKELGIPSPALIIRKIDNTSGEVKSSYAYQFKTDYHKSIRNFNQSNPTNYETVYHNNLELEQFLTLLEEYYKAATGAIAYYVVDSEKYQNNRLNSNINSIMDKLGVERKTNGNYSKNNGGRSFFDNSNQSSNNTQFQKKTMDDIGTHGNSPDDLEDD